ncbi:MAG TPA: choline-sulfatase, partial [Planctomycetaceae bacterium]|nr:choline-sulfatase [Planctomycetaceae bacterium]
EALELSGHQDDTIVVLWSDHGWHLGEKEITGKNTLWDRSTRVPLIFAGPGVVAGQRCKSPAELLDIYPTLVEMCDLPEKEGLEGHSLTPQLADATAKREWPAITTHNAGNHGLRTDKWRYIRYADGSDELYDMTSDPNEWHNVADKQEHARLVEELSKYLPETSADPAPGSAHRILTMDAMGNVIWEGSPIGKDDPIPELD